MDNNDIFIVLVLVNDGKFWKKVKGGQTDKTYRNIANLIQTAIA